MLGGAGEGVDGGREQASWYVPGFCGVLMSHANLCTIKHNVKKRERDTQREQSKAGVFE